MRNTRAAIAAIVGAIVILGLGTAALVVAREGENVQTESQAASKNLRSCASPSTEIVRENSRVRLFRVTEAFDRRGPLGVVAYESDNYVACDKSSGNWHVVYEGEWNGGPEAAILVDRYLALEIDHGCAACNYSPRSFELVDVGDGTINVLEETFGDGGNEFAIGRKQLTSGGVLVYTVERGADEYAEPRRGRGRPLGRQVVRYDARTGKRTVLDDGDSIELRSLKLDGSTATWIKGGIAKSARIR